MAIEGINTSMTSLQFARTLAATTRRVETSAATGSSAGESRSSAGDNPTRNPADPGRDTHTPFPPKLSWAYRAALINGRPVAQRTPQLAAADYWGAAVERFA